MKIIINGLLIILLIGSLRPAKAQVNTDARINSVLKGFVIDSLTKEPLSGVTLQIKGITHAVLSDQQGKFLIRTAQRFPYILQATFIGYATKEVEIDGSPVTISLAPQANNLTDVLVASGYGAQRKKDFTGSIAQVKASDLQSQPSQSFTQLLGGKAAGVSIIQPSSALNNPPVLRIRGVNSISSGIYPLIVLDGVTLFTGSAGGGVGNDPLADINPSDIESISILKDGSATAIYGSRAANGVLVITTKKGTVGKAKVNYDGWVSLSSASNLPELLDASDYVTIKNEARTNAGLSPGFALQTDSQGKTVSTDWYDVAYHTGVSQNHNVSVSGADEKTRYYLSLGYTNQNGFIRTNSFDRKIARFNIDRKLAQSLTIGANSSYSNSLNSGPNTGAVPPNSITGATGNSYNVQYIGTEPLARLTYILPPNVAAINEDGSYNINANNGTIGYGANSPSLGVFNAWNLQTILDLDKNTSENNAFIGNVYATWDITRHLTLKTSYGLDNLVVENKSFLNPYSGDGATARPSIIGGGAATNTQTKLDKRDWTNTLNYQLDFGSVHHIALLAGYEEIHTVINGWGAVRSGITDPYYNSYQGGWSNISATGNIQTENGLRSYFGNINYNYNDRYLLTLNVRRDGLSALATGHRWGNFGGGSVGWNISKEAFFENSSISRWLNDLKIRASYSSVGNSSIADFAALSQYSSSTYTGLATLQFSQAGNTNLRWEISHKTDIGLDAGLWQNRVEITADYYNNQVKGLILNSPQASSQGIPGNSLAANIGSLYNRGFELGISARVIENAAIRWNTSLNFSTLENKVTSLGGAGDIYPTALSTFGIQNMTREGYSVGSIFAVPTTGVNPENGNRVYVNRNDEQVQYDAVNKKFTYLDGTSAPSIDNYLDGRIQGPSLPTYFGGFNNNLFYHNFDLNVNITFSGGNKLYNGTKSTLADQRYFNNGTFILNRWTHEGQVTDIPKLVYGDSYSSGFASTNSWAVEDGSYAKLKSIALGYTIPEASLKGTWLSAIRFYVQATNLLTLTSYSGADPEVSINGNSINGGKDQNVPPNAKVVTFGLNLSIR